MGYLTTITLYNDESHYIKEFPKEFAEIVYEATLGIPDNRRKHHRVCGNTIFHQPRHADDWAMYLHIGNCTIDVANLKEMREIFNRNPEFYKQIIERVKYHLGDLKRVQMQESEVKNG